MFTTAYSVLKRKNVHVAKSVSMTSSLNLDWQVKLWDSMTINFTDLLSSGIELSIWNQLFPRRTGSCSRPYYRVIIKCQSDVKSSGHRGWMLLRQPTFHWCISSDFSCTGLEASLVFTAAGMLVCHVFIVLLKKKKKALAVMLCSTQKFHFF